MNVSLRKKFRVVGVIIGALLLPLIFAFLLSKPAQTLVSYYLPEPDMRIEGDVLHIDGALNTGSFNRVKKTLSKHNEIETIVLHTMPGSNDAEIAVALGRFIHSEGYTTALTPESRIASGATDLFLGGVKRIVPEGARIGVHAWSTISGVEAQKLHPKDPAHDIFLDYYRAVGIPEEFYWFVLEAAPPNDMYFLTEEDIERFGVRTE